MIQLTKEDVLKLSGNNIKLYCIVKKNGKIIFEGEREIRITNRDGRYAKKYGKFAHLYIINSNYPEFADWALTQNGTFYDDCSDNIWELSLFKLK